MKNTPPRYLVILFSTLIFMGHSNCSISQQSGASPPENSKESPATALFQLPYDLEHPDLSLELPQLLVEVSGLSLSLDANTLWTIQDEDGVVFEVNRKDGTIEREIPFGKPGDYEGLEQVDGTIYVVKSSGTIFKIKNPGKASQEVTKYNTPLNKDYDVEGLGYDPVENALLLACKGQPEDLAPETYFAKAIYHFYLDSMVLSEEPVMIIDRKDIIDYFKDHLPLIKVGKDGKEEIRDPKNLPCYPSGIAIHPITGDYYITSSKGKMLFITSPQGKLIHIEKLLKEIHPHPEGLVFDKNGNLFISNEGGDNKGKIYRFDYHVPKNQ